MPSKPVSEGSANGQVSGPAKSRAGITVASTHFDFGCPYAELGPAIFVASTVNTGKAPAVLQVALTSVNQEFASTIQSDLPVNFPVHVPDWYARVEACLVIKTTAPPVKAKVEPAVVLLEGQTAKASEINAGTLTPSSTPENNGFHLPPSKPANGSNSSSCLPAGPMEMPEQANTLKEMERNALSQAEAAVHRLQASLDGVINGSKLRNVAEKRVNQAQQRLDEASKTRDLKKRALLESAARKKLAEVQDELAALTRKYPEGKSTQAIERALAEARERLERMKSLAPGQSVLGVFYKEA
jgi:hypothetical protein